ncbi:MAG TPA: penicillin-binding transpeptidase domain-containing protein, partial [Patescibacteria group bacterium]|nr:penicillin-binding transpeptidase domain-containing protein [Patescibacteria group bacterium]
RGPVQIRFALGNSLNIPAVKMLARVGIKPVMQKAYDMGIENWQPTDANLKSVGLSLVLGGREATLLQETTAYSVFADQGIKHDPFSIVEVQNSDGKTIFKHQDSPGNRVLSTEISFLISHILLDDNARADAFGHNSLLNIPGKTVSVKTGTTDSKRDNWAMGYTPSYVVGVWVGNNDNTPMNPKIASGITGATPIWHDIMAAVLKGKKDEQPQVPPNVSAVQIDSFSGGLPRDGQPTRTEYFVKGTEPTTPAAIYKKLKISSHQDGKLANGDEIAHGDYNAKDYIVFEESDPVSTDGKNRWQEAIDAWVEQNHKDDPLYHPPHDTSDYKYGSNNNSPTDTPTPTPNGSPTPSPTVTLTPTPTP